MSDELTIEPGTGNLVPTATAAEIKADEASDEELELSIFSDGRDVAGNGAASYNLAIKMGGTSFKGNQLDKAALDTVKAKNKEIAAANERIKRIKHNGKAVEAAEELAQLSIAKDEWVINNSIKSWNNPKWPNKIPFNAESVAALTPAAKSKLADDILAKSYSGRGASDVAEDF